MTSVLFAHNPHIVDDKLPVQHWPIWLAFLTLCLLVAFSYICQVFTFKTRHAIISINAFAKFWKNICLPYFRDVIDNQHKCYIDELACNESHLHDTLQFHEQIYGNGCSRYQPRRWICYIDQDAFNNVGNLIGLKQWIRLKFIKSAPLHWKSSAR